MADDAARGMSFIHGRVTLPGDRGARGGGGGGWGGIAFTLSWKEFGFQTFIFHTTKKNK